VLAAGVALEWYGLEVNFGIETRLAHPALPRLTHRRPHGDAVAPGK
jgi:hypothetical protein